MESEGDAAQGFESAVDGFGGSVRRVFVVEEGEDAAHAFLQGAIERGQFGASGGDTFDGE